jgi:hypothetical protein
MPKNQVSDLVTDQEIAFALLVLSGTMTDRQAAEAVDLNPDTAAYTKAKPRVVAFMHEHRAEVLERLVQQQIEEVRRQNQSREQVLARLWQIANLDPEITRNSASAQIKALSMIVAIESLIPSGTNGRRAPASEKSASSPVVPPIDAVAWFREQQAKAAGLYPVGNEDGTRVSDPPPADAADTIDGNLARPPVSASAPDNRVRSSMEKTLSTLRLRL